MPLFFVHTKALLFLCRVSSSFYVEYRAKILMVTTQLIYSLSSKSISSMCARRNLIFLAKVTKFQMSENRSLILNVCSVYYIDNYSSLYKCSSYVNEHKYENLFHSCWRKRGKCKKHL